MRTAARPRSGFTIVELLVVVAIIVVLAALSIAVTLKALERSRIAGAVQAMRQISVAHIAFTQDEMGAINTLRDIADTEEGGSGAEVANSFWGRFVPYLFDDVEIEDQPRLRNHIHRSLDKLFQTTDVADMAKTVLTGSKIFTDGSELPVPLAFNTNLYVPNEWVTINQLSDPGTIIYATLGYEFFDEDDGREYVKRPRDGSDPTNNIYYLDNRKALVIFADGRVGYVDPPFMDTNFE